MDTCVSIFLAKRFVLLIDYQAIVEEGAEEKDKEIDVSSTCFSAHIIRLQNSPYFIAENSAKKS